MEWMVTKIRSYARVPFGGNGYPYAIDFEQGDAPGEVLIQVQCPFGARNMNEGARRDMLLDIRTNILRAESFIAVQRDMGPVGIKRHLFGTVRFYGKGFPEIGEDTIDSK
jgi:hypothetical protein